MDFEHLILIIIEGLNMIMLVILVLIRPNIIHKHHVYPVQLERKDVEDTYHSHIYRV